MQKHLKSGQKRPVLEWYEPTSKTSNFQMNPVFKCPVFGSPLYSDVRYSNGSQVFRWIPDHLVIGQLLSTGLVQCSESHFKMVQYSNVIWIPIKKFRLPTAVCSVFRSIWILAVLYSDRDASIWILVAYIKSFKWCNSSLIGLFYEYVNELIGSWNECDRKYY